jgi:hypothetical protein
MGRKEQNRMASGPHRRTALKWAGFEDDWSFEETNLEEFRKEEIHACGDVHTPSRSHTSSEQSPLNGWTVG